MHRKLLVVAIACFLCICSGCQKKKGNSISYSMKGTVNGAEFNGTNAIALAGPDSILSIYGGFFQESSLVPPYVFLHLCPYRGVGIYSLVNPPVNSTTVSYAAIDSAAYYQVQTQSAYGTVTITATSPIQGAFSFTALDSTKVSGTFVAKVP